MTVHLSALADDVEKQKQPQKEAVRGPRAAACFSRVFFLYVGSLVRASGKRLIEDDDLFDIPVASEVGTLVSKFDEKFQPNGLSPNELGEWRLMYKAMLHLFGRRYALATLGMLVQAIIQLGMPMVLRAYVDWFADQSQPGWLGWAVGGGIVLASFFANVLCMNHAVLEFYVIGMDARSVVNSVVYRKATQLSQKARSQTTTGQVLSIMSADSERLPVALLGMQSLLVSPVIVVMGMALLVWVMRWAAFVPIVFMFLTIPVPMKVGAFQGKVIGQLMQYGDKRVKLVNEGLQGVKVLKYYAWDVAYEDRVRALRDLEMGQVRRQAWAQAFSSAFASFSPILMSLGMIVVTYLTDRDNFTAANVFSALALVNVVRMPMVMLPMGIMGFVGMKATMMRLQKYLLLEEKAVSGLDAAPGRIKICDASFEWEVGEPIDLSGKGKGKGNGQGKGKGKGKGSDKGEAEAYGKGKGKAQPPQLAEESKADSFKLSGVNIVAEAGQLCMVVGTVGSGKSSLLSAILNDMPKRAGEVHLGGSVSYCAQMPWILNATLRDNILFGQPMDEVLYDDVIHMCALGPDCESLPGGDLTEIGEKGVTLSGGQKARVALARACYRQATVYLLDDVLSAVDSETGSWLFQECIRALTAKGSIVVLATNNVHFLEHGDCVWVLKDGRVAEQGTWSDLRAIPNGALNELLSSQATTTEPIAKQAKEVRMRNVERPAGDSSSPGIVRSTTRLSGSSQSGNLTAAEKRAEGAVSWGVWVYYFVTCPGGIHITSAVVFFSLLTQASKNMFDLWLSSWTAKAAESPELGLGYHFYVYVSLGFFASVLVLWRSISWAELIIRNGRRLHELLLHGIMRAPMSFFDTTPLGRIINRFSKDVDSMDQQMQRCLPQFINLATEILGIVVSIGIGMPLFFIALVPMALFYFDVTRRFRPVNRDLQRLESVSRSPLFAQFSETLVGISTIRAYGDTQRFLAASAGYINQSNRAFYTIHVANRWLQIRLETLSCVLLSAVIAFSIYGRGNGTVTAGVAALALFYAIGISGFLNFCIRMAVDTEARMTSAERIYEYAAKVQPEAQLVTEHRPSVGWPSVGRIELKDVTMRYRPNLPQVLKGVSVVIEGGMKVGICGRTGCGKSTLFSVLFRLVDIGSSSELGTGTMLIDSVDILKLGLHDLRKALAIIPQDAVMFSGSLRDNLDLFHERTEDQLWSALRHASLETAVQELPGGLEANVQEGGENFSCGQRQLVCLARALLRQPKIICLDEATANIDVKTDAALQEVIKTEFKDQTTLTIAHRLNTIMHSDRILVLDAGQVVEFASPAELLAGGRESHFRALVQELGDEASAEFKREVLGAAAAMPRKERPPQPGCLSGLPQMLCPPPRAQTSL